MSRRNAIIGLILAATGLHAFAADFYVADLNAPWTGDGTQQKPFGTVQMGMWTAFTTPGDHVLHIGAGTYTDQELGADSAVAWGGVDAGWGDHGGICMLNWGSRPEKALHSLVVQGAGRANTTLAANGASTKGGLLGRVGNQSDMNWISSWNNLTADCRGGITRGLIAQPGDPTPGVPLAVFRNVDIYLAPDNYMLVRTAYGPNMTTDTIEFHSCNIYLSVNNDPTWGYMMIGGWDNSGFGIGAFDGNFTSRIYNPARKALDPAAGDRICATGADFWDWTAAFIGFWPDPKDRDGDGLLDAWENYYGTNTNFSATGDFDGDGMNDGNEYIAGTNPADKQDVLKLTLWKAGDGTHVRFTAVPTNSFDQGMNRYYSLYSAAVPASAWTGVDNFINFQNTLQQPLPVEYTYTGNATSAFFRAAVWLRKP